MPADRFPANSVLEPQARRAILLVTGSRAYPGPWHKIRKDIFDVMLDFSNRYRDHELILAHGACPHPARSDGYSVDTLADSLAVGIGFGIEAMAVEFAKDGPWPGAGPRRNARMVNWCAAERDNGAIVEVAGFPHPDKRKRAGTGGTLKLARAAGLEVIRG